MDCIAGDKVLFQAEKDVKVHNKFTPDIHVMKGTDITGESTSEGKINDFVQYFKSRYLSLRRIIEKRPDFGRGMDIEKARTMDRECHVIGIIYEKNETKNGHTMLTLEDETGTMKILISKDSELAGQCFVEDEVIGAVVRPNSQRTLFIANSIVRPDIPKKNAWEETDSVSKIAFLSDVHVGSSTFLENDWLRMVKWLKENSVKQDINYIVFPGDVVDGIGVFPDQDKELDISDIYQQYEKLAEYLKDVPDHIKMVIHPGNHDACRLAEPQPALNPKFTGNFDSNILMVGNPIYLEVEGRKVLTYHGKSMDDWIASVQYLTYTNPLKVMQEMCVRRHLAPIYGQRNALAPEKKDYLVMETIPDIFVSGHVHGVGEAVYNGVRMINASTWQSQTEYQRMHNFNPDPGIMPTVDLATGKIEMHNFHSA
jgi:DNA polymerase II small subunit